VLLLLGSGCSASVDEGRHPADKSITPSATLSPTAAVALFVELAEQACTDGPVPDPTKARAEPAADGKFSIIDVEGAEVVLDPGARIVHSIDGPDGILPFTYSPYCDEKIFVGTADH
ncbi:MAG TPA: hypothetical protein VMY34_10820, partial [Acidimicrobiales bacterium]|nr:hypothetical protein [Acidimicrobiales bacterium]